MAKTITKAFGTDANREKAVHRLGSVSATGQANTWRTFTTCHVNAGGSGFVRVVRDNAVLHTWTFGAEALIRQTAGERS